jgi:hypothetical protein
MTIFLGKFPTVFIPSKPSDPLYTGQLQNGQMSPLATLDLLANNIIQIKYDLANDPLGGGGVQVGNTDASGLGLYQSTTDNVAKLRRVTSDEFVDIELTGDDNALLFGVNVSNLTTSLLSTGALRTELDSKATLVGGKIPRSQLDIDGVDYFGEVNNQDEMLALNSTVGDWCHRKDILGPTGEPEEWVCVGSTPHVLASWRARKDVVAGVSAINGQSGTLTVDKAFVGLSKVENYSLSEMVNTVGSPIKTALDARPLTTAIPGLVRSNVGVSASPGLLTYNNTTGQFTSGFTQAIKDEISSMSLIKHQHQNFDLLASITPERMAIWDANDPENPNPGVTVDKVASELILNNPTTTWTHTPDKPNRYAIGDKPTTFAPDQIAEGSYGTIDFIMDGTGNHDIKFAGVAPDNYPGVAANQGPYAMWLFSWHRDRTSLSWGAKFKGFGSNKLATPIFTATDLGATGTRLEFPLSAGANRYNFTRITKANYDTAIANGTTPSWGGPQTIDVAPYSPFILKRDSTQTGSTSYMPAGVWYLRMQAVDTTNAKQPSDFYIVGPFTKS